MDFSFRIFSFGPYNMVFLISRAPEQAYILIEKKIRTYKQSALTSWQCPKNFTLWTNLKISKSVFVLFLQNTFFWFIRALQTIFLFGTLLHQKLSQGTQENSRTVVLIHPVLASSAVFLWTLRVCFLRLPDTRSWVRKDFEYHWRYTGTIDM